jgi:hypothetical protein
MITGEGWDKSFKEVIKAEPFAFATYETCIDQGVEIQGLNVG